MKPIVLNVVWVEAAIIVYFVFILQFMQNQAKLNVAKLRIKYIYFQSEWVNVLKYIGDIKQIT